MRGLNTYESFRSVVEHALSRQARADAVVVTGDLVQDETRHGYELFCEVMQSFNAPVHCLPGNHDSPRIMAEMLNTEPFQYCGTAHYDNWCLIMLDSSVRWNDGGYLEPARMTELEKALQANSDQHVLIALHHHPLATGSRWLDGLNLRNSEEFLQLIDRYDNVRGVIWGHVHQSAEHNHNGVLMMSTPSTGAQFRPNSDVFMMDERTPGYRWLELHPDGHIGTEVIWI